MGTNGQGLLIIIVVLLPFNLLAGTPVNINSANRNQLETLPLTQKQVDGIENYLNYKGYFSTIYDLLKVEGISAEDVHKLKTLIIVEVPELSQFIQGERTSSYKVEQWLAAEGNTEGLSEVWLDRYFEPRDINDMNYDDLNSLPNLSPVDVVAVLKQKKRGHIYGSFELRNSPGISNWGYKNLIDFVRFSTDSSAKLQPHLRVTQLIRTVPVTTNPDDEGTISAFSDDSRPEIFRKFSLSYGNHLKFGYSYHKEMGNPAGVFLKKRFISVENITVGNIRLDRFILGSYTTSFGQGVIMETGDFFSPRRTGYGFTKRAEGIYPDLTRSSQYVMDGAALQVSSPYFRGTLFASLHPRDAIINADGSFSTLIVMQPRLPFGAIGDTTKIYHKITGSVDELTWGGNIRLSPFIGTNIGFTFYESLYDRILNPKVIETLTGGADDHEPEFDDIGVTSDYDEYSGDAFYLAYMTNSADPEIAAMYRSHGKSELWKEAKSFRRVVGMDYTFVLGNVAFQGEYGELSTDQNIFRLGNEPHALLISVFSQFDNLNLLALYRDYDLEFDNPYQRSFSNYQRYKTTIFEDDYWLEDPVYSYLYSGNPQPQSEQGVFISGRYQFHRSFVGTLNWDTWTRKADDAKYFRTVATIDWRPVFNYRINIRQKWQARGAFDIMHPSPFQSRETRIRVRLRLSGFDQIELLYSLGYTTFSPRPRLTDNAVAGADMVVGDIGSPDETLGISINHNFDDHLRIKGGILFIQGFLWYFEDTDFRIFNTDAGMFHSWVAFYFRPVANLSVSFKVSYAVDQTTTKITEGQTESGNWLKNPVVNNSNTDFRIQLDYAI